MYSTSSSTGGGYPRIDIPDALESLASFLAQQTGSKEVRVHSCERLSGGAIQENWLLRAHLQDGDRQVERHWVLRTDAASSVAVSMSREQEFAVLQAVHMAGVKVPEPLWLCRDPKVIGRDFFIMQALSGSASGYRLSTDQTLEPQRAELCRELGRSLAFLHSITPDHPALGFLPSAVADPAQASIDQYRLYLDALPGSHPVIEWGLRWCELNRPEPLSSRLIHRDYRTGNYMVDQGRLSGVLDWEFAGWGDPREDLGWFTAKCWRFARPDRHAGGVGRIDDFLDGYQSVSGCRPSANELKFWQLMAHLRWAVVALQQAQRHLTGQQRSLELALTGRMVPELEYEILSLSGGA
ncbi:phosphotransferase family protein [Pseudomonas sp. BN415]|jgi:aminoglycoside phosphotransferase (APT) family kinase protein|uniref:phosphotransferase family protein n=1 Tax=Pseudomonas sp. BN415 TaxID=2567889 RepID=UPI002456C8C2|nr:phosphotransferase family protein [Pseudomonas sp. BN415]MDH4582816.1 phosphotransferase family protein [Pseudomonas sp. BN415]